MARPPPAGGNGGSAPQRTMAALPAKFGSPIFQITHVYISMFFRGTPEWASPALSRTNANTPSIRQNDRDNLARKSHVMGRDWQKTPHYEKYAIGMALA